MTACASTESDRDRPWVSGQLAARVGAGTAPAAAEEVGIPLGVVLADGLDEDEAVAIALFNHPAFEAALAELEVSRATLLQSGLLKNPVLSLLFPVGPMHESIPAPAAKLTEIAYASRPEVRAAELRVEAAVEKAQLSREDIAVVSAIVDANAKGTEGFEAGPGLAIELPLFDQGQGRRALADAGLSAAVAQARAVRYPVRETVARTRLEAEQTRALVQAWREGPLAGSLRVREDVGRMRAARDATALDEVDADAVVVTGRLDLLDRESAARRAFIELEHAVGRRLSP